MVFEQLAKSMMRWCLVLGMIAGAFLHVKRMIIDSNANKKGQELEEGRGKEDWEMENNW